MCVFNGIYSPASPKEGSGRVTTWVFSGLTLWLRPCLVYSHESLHLYVTTGSITVKVPATLKAYLYLSGNKVDVSPEVELQGTQNVSREGRITVTGKTYLLQFPNKSLSLLKHHFGIINKCIWI